MLPLCAALLAVLTGMLAFAVDLGYIAIVRGQMQNAADAAALAATSQLLDRGILQGDTTQASALIVAEEQGRRFAAANEGGRVPLTLGSGDIVYGRIEDPRNPQSPFVTNVRPYNSAQVTVQRSQSRNGELGLFFATIFGTRSLPLSAKATATYEGNVNGFKFNTNYPNQKCLLLPYTLDVKLWDAAVGTAGTGTDAWTCDPTTRAVTAGKDRIKEVKLFPTKGNAPGNFGTVDIGAANNSTADISRQIRNGPNAADFAAMGGTVALDANGELVLEGDTGISAGVKDDFLSIVGQPRIIPLYSKVTGNGNNSRYTIVRWVGCVVLDVQLTGGNKYITIQPEFAVDSTAIGGGPASGNSFAMKPLQLSR